MGLYIENPNGLSDDPKLLNQLFHENGILDENNFITYVTNLENDPFSTFMVVTSLYLCFFFTICLIYIIHK
jgi:hypothetical protein